MIEGHCWKQQRTLDPVAKRFSSLNHNRKPGSLYPFSELKQIENNKTEYFDAKGLYNRHRTKIRETATLSVSSFAGKKCPLSDYRRALGISLKSVSTSRSPSHIPAIDGLRAVAVLSVLFFHLKPEFLPGGFTGVDVFFVISGYVVTKSLSEYETGNLAAFLGKFFSRRLARIYPPLIACLLATGLFSALFIPRAYISDLNASIGKAAFFGYANLALLNYRDTYFSPVLALNP